MLTCRQKRTREKKRKTVYMESNIFYFGDNIKVLKHPLVVEWLLQSQCKYKTTQITSKRSCLEGVNQSLLLIKSKKQYNGNNVEIGIAGSSLSDDASEILYNKMILQYNKTNEIQQTRTDQWERTNALVTSTKEKISNSLSMGSFWSKAIYNTETNVDALKSAFEKQFRDAATTGAKILKVELPGHYTIQWEPRDFKPIDVAVYNPGTATLVLHTWVLQHFRRCDVVILALHEIVGHHYQEQHGGHTSVLLAENCGMLCEQVASRAAWSDPTTGEKRSLEKAVWQWHLFRIRRAQVDLRLHSRVVRKLLNEQDGMTRDASKLWRKQDEEFIEMHLVPLPDETYRCAGIPGQAQTYILPQQVAAISNCACNQV